MPNSNTPKARKARADNAAAWTKKQVEDGAYRFSALLPPNTAEKLKAMAKRGNRSKASIVIRLIDEAPDEE